LSPSQRHHPDVQPRQSSQELARLRFLSSGIHFDIEVLVVDDASSDATPDVVHLYPQVHYLRLETNRGSSCARNTGIRASRGKYIAFLDDDDVWLPHRLHVQVPFLETHPDIGVVYGHGITTDEAGRSLTWPETGPSGWVFEDFLTRTDDFVNVDTLLVRRDAFDKAGYFDEEVPTMEHYDMALRLARHYQWQFIPGHVAHGRFWKRGKWASNVISGCNEQTLPRIVERALSTLPDTPRHMDTKKKARVAVCKTITEQRWWWNGGVGAVRAYLLASLQVHPWLADDPTVRELLDRVARQLACTSPSPLVDVGMFWRQITSNLDGRGFRTRLRNWHLLGRFLAEASRGLREDGWPRRSACAGICAIVCDPTQFRWSAVKTLLNACRHSIVLSR
jgi:glycosyltransferase involved in cell wall biosynthesis